MTTGRKSRTFDLFKQAKQYPLEAVLTRYGIEPGYNGSFRCPFHDDHKPSAGIYENKHGEQRWNCFACEARGTAIDFVMLMEHCSALEAATRICERAGHNVPDSGRSANKTERHSATRQPIIKVNIKVPQPQQGQSKDTGRK